MIGRNKSKLIFLGITLAVIMCFIGIRSIIIEATFLTEEDIQYCKQKIGVILTGKEYDKETYNILPLTKDDIVVTYIHDRTQSVNFYIKNNKIVNYTVVIDEFSLALNSIFALLTLICTGLSITLIVICVITIKEHKYQEFTEEFDINLS